MFNSFKNNNPLQININNMHCKNNHIFKTNLSSEKMAWSKIFAHIFNVYFKRRQLNSQICFCIRYVKTSCHEHLENTKHCERTGGTKGK